jgi:hypothetical protein
MYKILLTSNFPIIILMSSLFSIVYKEKHTSAIIVCAFSLAIAAFVPFYFSHMAFCCVFMDYSGLWYNSSSINERKFFPYVVVKLKEVVLTAHRYSRIICHLLMGIVLKIEMVGSLNCTSVLNDRGMNPLLLLCMYQKYGTACTSDRQFETKYLELIYVFPFHLQYKDWTSLAGQFMSIILWS